MKPYISRLGLAGAVAGALGLTAPAPVSPCTRSNYGTYMAGAPGTGTREWSKRPRWVPLPVSPWGAALVVCLP
ncbi:hypothetical protein EDB80DRAFT_723363 [Ilyonectria destructans]|nr:hypothetical protein EDB80DRAFT_723363 [Ilyonectria destructans]